SPNTANARISFTTSSAVRRRLTRSSRQKLPDSPAMPRFPLEGLIIRLRKLRVAYYRQRPYRRRRACQDLFFRLRFVEVRVTDRQSDRAGDVTRTRASDERPESTEQSRWLHR